jgi:glycine cleavage system H protein
VNPTRDTSVYYRRSRFTTHLPKARRYSPAHYWLMEESPGIWRVGLTKFATRMLGDIVEFDFSVTPGTAVGLGDEIGSIEGLKAVTSVFSAGSGTFMGEGPGLRADVTLAESDPYGEAWLYRLQGAPGADTVDVDGYVAILDATIDKMIAGRHGEHDEHDDDEHDDHDPTEREDR